MNIMINPCEGHDFNCCYDTFGTPECVDGGSCACWRYASHSLHFVAMRAFTGIALRWWTARIRTLARRCSCLLTGLGLTSKPGTPRSHVAPPSSVRAQRLCVRVCGNVCVILVNGSRLPDDAIIINEDCVGLIDPEFNCIGFRSFKTPFDEFPVCWDRNDTVSRGQWQP